MSERWQWERRAWVWSRLRAEGRPRLVPSVAASDSGVVISEFRFRGPAGGNDEFIELHNTASSPVDISGYKVLGCTSSTGVPSATPRATVEAVLLEPGQHYLFTNGASGGYSGSVQGDQSYTTGISDNVGVQLVTGGGGIVDAAGSSVNSANQCREGTGLAWPSSGSGDYSFERRGGGTQDTGDNAADFSGPQTGTPESSGGAEPPPPPITKIHDIQGPGPSSPMTGQTVTIEGVVTGWDDEIGASFSRTFPEDAGIFVQEEPGDADSDPATSEGIFAGFVRARDAYPAGSVVQLEGRVTEKFGFTMIAETFDTEPVIVGSAATPEPVEIDAALAESQSPDTRSYYETLEGMRVRLVSGTANSGGTNKFGEAFVTPGAERDRVFRTESEPALIATDADAGAGDPDNPFKNPIVSSTQVNADLFDHVGDIVGPLAFSFSHYKIMVQPGRLPTVTPGPTTYPYDGLSPTGDYQIRVASFNVENFLPVGAELDLSPVSEEEYAEKRDKIVDAIDRLMVRPDVIAVQEVGRLADLEEVAAQLGNYSAYLEEGNDERGIDVGFLVKGSAVASNVRQFGKDAAGPPGFDCSDVDGGLFDRPPLAIDIGAQAAEFTVFSNHFSSKSAPDECRAAQAAFVRDRVAEIESDGGQALVAGDLNAFEDESALLTLQDGQTTLTNQWSRAPEQERYSFAFSGKLQTLDHVLITDGLDARVEGFKYAHFDNDYFERVSQTDGHHVSDHDPPVLTLSTSACPAGDDRATVVVGSVDSRVPNRDTGDGCSINDLIREEDYDTGTALVRHVDSVTDELVAEGVITKKEKQAILRAARRHRP